MREIYTIKREDFKWSETGDFVVKSGDIADTREIPGLGFLEEIEVRVKSSLDDWKLEKEKGCNLHKIKGKINNKDTWTEISNVISFGLVADAFLSYSDFKVYVAPVSHLEVAVRVEFSDNIRRVISPKIKNLKLIFNLMGEGPYLMR